MATKTKEDYKRKLVKLFKRFEGHPEPARLEELAYETLKQAFELKFTEEVKLDFLQRDQSLEDRFTVYQAAHELRYAESEDEAGAFIEADLEEHDADL